MATIQTTFSQDKPNLRHASVATTWGPPQVETLVVAADTDIGIAVQQDANGKAAVGVTLNTGHAVTDFAGIVLADPSRVSASDEEIPENRPARIITRGDIAIKVAAAVVAGTLVGITPTTGVLAAAVTSPSATASNLPNARWKTSAAANGVAILRLYREGDS